MRDQQAAAIGLLGALLLACAPIAAWAQASSSNESLREALLRGDGVEQLPIAAELLRRHRSQPIDDPEPVASVAETLVDRHPDPALRADVLNHLSWLRGRRGDAQRAEALARRALALTEAHGRPQITANSHYMLGVALFLQSRQTPAIEAAEAALARYGADEARAERARVHTLLGAIHRSRSDYTHAADHHGEALALSESLGDAAGIARSRNNLGLLYWELDEYEQARELITRAAAHYRTDGPRSNLASALSNLGLIEVELGRPREAIVALEEALALDGDLQNTRLRTRILSNLGFAHSTLGESERAIDYLQETLALREADADGWGLARVLGALAAEYARLGQTDAAEAAYLRGLKHAREAEARNEEARIQDGLATLYENQGRHAEAVAALRRARSLDSQIEPENAVARIRELEARQAAETAARVLERERQRQRMLVLAAAFLAVLILALLAFIRSRAALLRDIRRSRDELARTAGDLADSEQRYRSLFEDTNEVKLLLDVEAGTIIDGNAAARRLCGDVRGVAVERVSPRWLSAALLDAQPTTAAPHSTATTWSSDDGETRHADVRLSPVPLAGRAAALVSVHDTTAERAQEEARIRTGRLESLGVLAGGIAHEFNNALGVVLGYVSMAREEIADDGEAKELLRAAEHSIDHCARLTGNLLSFSDGGAPRRERHDVGLQLRDAVALAATGSAVAVRLEIDADLREAEIDVAQLKQLVNNLVSNGIHAMGGTGSLSVRATNFSTRRPLAPSVGAGDFLRIDVVDTGVGIPAALQSRVMDPYFTTRDGASGLGLASAFAIATRHGGWLDFESREGAGSTFSVYLPAAPDATRHPSPATHAAPKTRLRVLVMDDDPAVQAMYRTALRRLGYDATITADGAEAVAQHGRALDEGQPFDVVLMDLTVPGGMGGREAIAAIRRVDAAVPAIVASGYSNDPVMSEYEQAGFSAVLAKPFSLDALSSVLRKVLPASSAGDTASLSRRPRPQDDPSRAEP